MAEHTFAKKLTGSDLQKWLGTLLPGGLEAGSSENFRVFDDSGKALTFCLKIQSRNLNKPPEQYREKPEFKAKGWTEFVAEKGLKVDDTICFWKDYTGGHIIVTIHKKQE